MNLGDKFIALLLLKVPEIAELKCKKMEGLGKGDWKRADLER